MKTTLVLDDDLYQRVKVLASQRNRTVSSVVEDALTLMLSADAPTNAPTEPMPSWDMGQPLVDIDDARSLRQTLDTDRASDALR